MSLAYREQQTPSLDFSERTFDESFREITSNLGTITVKPVIELTPSEQDDLCIARQLRTEAMLEEYGDNEYRTFKPVHM